MAGIEFLTVEDVLDIHADQIERYGGSKTLRDISLLASAVAQPQATFDGQWLHSFPFEMAAALLFHLVENHPFVDGNKRAGAVAALLFLNLNGIEFEAQPGELFEITMSVANGKSTKQVVADFLQAHSSQSSKGTG